MDKGKRLLHSLGFTRGGIRMDKGKRLLQSLGST